MKYKCDLETNGKGGSINDYNKKEILSLIQKEGVDINNLDEQSLTMLTHCTYHVSSNFIDFCFKYDIL